MHSCLVRILFYSEESKFEPACDVGRLVALADSEEVQLNTPMFGFSRWRYTVVVFEPLV